MAENTIELNCGKCGQKVRLHNPVVTRVDDAYCSAVILLPSWSVDERKCPSCGYIISPVFANSLPYAWVSRAPAEKEEKPRIIQPGALPMDFEKRLKAGGQ